MPPPALASTTSSASCSWALAISACICWACLSSAFMSKPPGPPPLAIGHFLGVELALQPLDQIFLADGFLGLLAGLLVAIPFEEDEDGAQALADDRPQRLGDTVASIGALGLLLVEGGAGRKPDPQLVLLVVDGNRAGAVEQRLEHRRARLLKLVEHRGPDPQQP